MNRCSPQVSIGMPIFNGENYLEAALESILNQTFEDFELILSDNASTDRTEEICHHYAAKDARIRYIRQPEKLSVTENFNYTFRVSTGTYFKWAAHDDLLTETFLKRCVEVLDRDPTVILVYPNAMILMPDGTRFPCPDNDNLRLDASEARHRFHDLICTSHFCFAVFGVMRSQVLAQTPLQGCFAHADGVLLARLALMGRFFEVPECLFYSRQHPTQASTRFIYSQEQPDYHSLTHWIRGSTKSSQVVLPHWRIVWEYGLSLWQNPVNVYDWLVCHRYLMRWIKFNRSKLLHDLMLAFQYWFERIRTPHIIRSSRIDLS